jgi:hypothetical protein
MRHQFLAPIRQGPGIGVDWRADVTRALRDDYGVALTVHGSIEAHDLLGAYAFVDLEQPWPAHPCPFVGPVVGQLRFELTHSDGVRALAFALARVGAGPVQRDDGAVLQPVRVRSFPLGDLVDPYGFDAGAAVLSGEAAYLAHVHHAVAGGLSGLGLHFEGLDRIESNPIHLPCYLEVPSGRRWVGLWRVVGAGVREPMDAEEAARILAGREVAFWGYDFDAIEDLSFWGTEPAVRSAQS